jgi:hypothetical protein
MVFQDKQVHKDLKEKEVYLLFLFKTIIHKIILGGSVPSLWGDVGLPGARGRPGGKYY